MDRVEELVARLRRRELTGSFQVAYFTADLLRHVVSSTKWQNGSQLLEQVKQIAKRLVEAEPLELCVGNVARRVLYIIREELGSNSKQDKSSIPSSVLDSDPATTPGSGKSSHIRHTIIEGINELIEELRMIHSSIAEQAIEHIHANEVILTYGKSKTVAEFLRAAAKKRSFEVIVAETAPSFMGQDMAILLSGNGISTTVIPDSAVFAIMTRVHKVILGSHAVMANGGLITHSGAHMIALAAQTHSVPVMVVAGSYKLCPLFPYDQDTFNELLSPASVLNFEEITDDDACLVQTPAYDYVPPDLVSLLVTNMGGHNPSYIYRLLQEYYDPDDKNLTNV